MTLRLRLLLVLVGDRGRRAAGRPTWPPTRRCGRISSRRSTPSSTTTPSPSAPRWPTPSPASPSASGGVARVVPAPGPVDRAARPERQRPGPGRGLSAGAAAPARCRCRDRGARRRARSGSTPSSGGSSNVTYRVLAEPIQVDGNAIGTVIVAIPLNDVHHTLGRLLLIEVLVSAAVLIVLGVPGVVDRAPQPATARSDGHHGRGHRRGRPVAAGGDHRPAHRGGPARQRPQHHADGHRGRLRGPRRVRRAAAAIPRRRVARVAHPADVDPRLLRALRPRRARPARGPRHLDAPHPRRGQPDERARRRPARSWPGSTTNDRSRSSTST